MRSRARFILSRRKLLEQYSKVKEMADLVSYSFKTNFEVGKVLEKETDCLFSIHSIESAEMLSDKDRLWFLAQAWDKTEIAALFKMGIMRFIVDNESDLKKIIAYVEQNNKKIWLLLRLKLKEHTIHTGKYYVYGMSSEAVVTWIAKLKNHKNVEKLGIHFHRKTQNLSEWSLKYELESVLDEQSLKAIDFVNIGGGLPIEYKNFRPNVMKNIASRISELRQLLRQHGIQMIIEPGRFIAGPSIVLETKIMNIYEGNIVVNCSVWNAAMDTFIAHMRLLVEGEQESGAMYTIKGNSPDSMDILRYRVFLPEKKVGDTIRFLNAGAYNFHSDFCNLPKLETVQVD